MPVLPRQDAWDRIISAARRSEAEEFARAFGAEGRPGGTGGINVKVTGDPVIVTTTTTTTGTSYFTTSFPSTTTSTTSTTCAPLFTTTAGPTTTTTSGPKYLYPGKFVYRNVDSLTNQEWWHEGDDCWIQEVHNEGLGLNCVYPGQVAGEYMGQVIVGVRGSGDNLPCGTDGATLSTFQDCVGYCRWVMNASTGKWELGTKTCCPSITCDCPQPDFCPPDNTCADTFTFCSSDADNTVPIVGCGSTTTGTGTTTTGTTLTSTTTTPDPMSCGTGCSCKHVDGVGSIQLLNDCNSGLALAGGCFCAGCVCIPNPSIPCSVTTVPCGVTCPPPPPPPFCDGNCTWVSTGTGWVGLTNSCNGNEPCVCEPPSFIGSCNARVTTPCLPPKPPPPPTTGTGTTIAPGTTTLRGTTTTAGGCSDNCLLQWVVTGGGSGHWSTVSSCGASCACSDPGYDGVDNCTLAIVPCKPTTTGTTTSTTGTTTTGTGTTATTTPTSLTTTTTTALPCCGLLANCVFQCIQFGTMSGGGGQGVPIYQWVGCRDGCDVCATCTQPTNIGPCNAVTVGTCAVGFCQAHAGGTGPCSCNPDTQCWNGTQCVDCTTTGITNTGIGTRCGDCMDIINADAADLGETGVF